MRTRPWPRSLASLCLGLLPITDLVAGDVAEPRNDAAYHIDWYAISSGGWSTASSASHVLRGSVGQPVIGASTSNTYVLSSGFWFGVSTRCDDCLFSNGFEAIQP